MAAHDLYHVFATLNDIGMYRFNGFGQWNFRSSTANAENDDQKKEKDGVWSHGVVLVFVLNSIAKVNAPIRLHTTQWNEREQWMHEPEAPEA
jgi:hypothetical protein